MPTISRFYGITIHMYYEDHLPPHFHAFYRGNRITVEIGTGIVRGDFSPRALGMVREWATIHRDDLMDCWERARRYERLSRIAPLD